MLRNSVLLIVLLFLSAQLHSQILMYEKTYTAPFATCKAMDLEPGRGTLIAGTTWTQNTSLDITVIHTDSLGALAWSHTYGTNGADYAEDISFTSDGGFILTGTQYFSLDSAHMIAMKFDAAGTILWSNNYRVDRYCTGISCVESSDGGCAFFGYSYTGETIGGPYHATLIKTNTNGIFEWSQTYLTGQGMDGLCVRAVPDGGFILGARSFRGSFDAKVLLIKTNANGAPQWTKEFGSSSDEVLQRVEPLANGGWIVGGYSQNPSSGVRSAFLMKVDSGGNPVWIKNYGPSSGKYDCVDVTPMSDGGFAFVGQYEPPSQITKGVVTRTDSNGTILSTWSCAAPGGWDHLYEIQPTPDGGCFVGGDDQSSVIYYSFCVARTEDDGTGICTNSGPVLTSSTLALSDTNAFLIITTNSTSGNYPAILLPDSVTQQTICTNVGQQEIATSVMTISAFPNPACDVINLSFTGYVDNTEIQLINSLGETILLEKQFSGTEFQFNTTELCDGYYIVRAIVNSATQCSAEFVKISN